MSWIGPRWSVAASMALGLALLTGCQTYGSRTYRVAFEGGGSDVKRYAVPHTEWVKHPKVENRYETTEAKDKALGWMSKWELPTPPEKRLPGWQFIYVVLEKQPPDCWLVYQKSFTPGTDPQEDPKSGLVVVSTASTGATANSPPHH